MKVWWVGKQAISCGDRKLDMFKIDPEANWLGLYIRMNGDSRSPEEKLIKMVGI